MFEIQWTAQARAEFDRLERSPAEAARFKAVGAAIGKLAANPRHPGLNTHAYKGKTCPHGETLWEAYAQNNTPGAYRIFFCYPPAPPPPAAPATTDKKGKKKGKPPPPPPPQRLILLVAITEHP